MKQEHDLTQGSILKGFLAFALPLLLGSLFQQLYNTVDLLYIGNFLGKNSAAAVGASSILVTCLIGLFTGISVGAGVVAAQYWGAGNTARVKRCICNSLLSGLIGGIAITVLGELLAKWFLVLLNTPEGILEEALVYIRIFMLSILPMILYNMSAGILRALGDSRTPFLVLAGGGILNVCMDAVFIVLLRWNVAGAAFASLISQSFTAIVLTVYLFRREQLLHQDWHTDRVILWKILYVGFPLGIQSMILTLSNLFVQHDINGFGENAIAAFTVYFKVENLVYLPIVAFGQAMVTFTGQNFGAGKMERIRKAAFSCNAAAVLITEGIAVLVLIFGEQVFGLFCSDEEVISEGMKILSVTFPLYFLYTVQEVTGGIVRGVGKTTQSMLIVICTLCVFRVFFLKLLVNGFHTIQAVAAVYPLTWGLAALAFVFLYFFKIRNSDVHADLTE